MTAAFRIAINRPATGPNRGGDFALLAAVPSRGLNDLFRRQCARQSVVAKCGDATPVPVIPQETPNQPAGRADRLTDRRTG